MSNSVWAHNLNFKALILFLHQRIMLKMNIEKSADDTIDVEELDYVGNAVLIVEGESPNTVYFSIYFWNSSRRKSCNS